MVYKISLYSLNIFICLFAEFIVCFHCGDFLCFISWPWYPAPVTYSSTKPTIESALSVIQLYHRDICG